MKSLLTVILLFVAIIARGQQYMDSTNPKEIKSLLSKENELNGFGGFSLKVGDINLDRALLVGGYGGVLINRNYMLGLAGFGIATESRFNGMLPDNSPRKLNIHGGYGGLLIGGTILSKEIIHLNIPIVLGAGALYISDHNFFQNGVDTDFTIEQSAFFVVEPGAEIEFNITKGLRFAAGATYRYIQGLELKNLKDADLTNWTTMISVRFGRF